MSWFTQDKNEEVHTKVKGGHSADKDVPTTEFVMAERDGSGHQHVVIDEGGNEIHNEWVEGR